MDYFDCILVQVHMDGLCLTYTNTAPGTQAPVIRCYIQMGGTGAHVGAGFIHDWQS